jgi:hypothetical protein
MEPGDAGSSAATPGNQRILKGRPRWKTYFLLVVFGCLVLPSSFSGFQWAIRRHVVVFS